MDKTLKQKFAIVVVIYFFMFIASMLVNVSTITFSPLIAWFSM